MHSSYKTFHQSSYLEINFRRLEHLASLGFSFRGKTVVELGAGIGDLSPFFIAQGANLTIAEGRPENLKVLRHRYPPEKYSAVRIVEMDLNSPDNLSDAPFDITFCYGLLYQLTDPAAALDFMATITNGLLFLETYVSPLLPHSVDQAAENALDPSQALDGKGCRPGRNWLYRELAKRFKYVYLPTTQPDHQEFVLDWESPQSAPNGLSRAIFIASSNELKRSALVTEPPSQQLAFRKKPLKSSLGHALSRPPIIELETVNVCNSRCTFCPSRNQRRKKRTMSPELYQKVLRELSETGCTQLCFTPMLGDALLDSETPLRLEALKQCQRIDTVRLVTNLIALDRFNDQEVTCLIESTDIFEISLGPNKEEYKAMFGVDRFEKVLANLARLADLSRITRRVPQFKLCGRAGKRVPEVDPRLLDLSQRLPGSHYILWRQSYMDWGGQIDSLPLEAEVETCDRSDLSIVPCHYALCPNIYSDGTVSLCACAGLGKEFHIGDLNKQSLADILASPARKKHIMSFMLGKPPTYCTKCSFYRLDNTIDWRMLFPDTVTPPKLSPQSFVEFSFAKRHHFKVFSGLDKELYGREIAPNSCDLKNYQDLLVYAFVKGHVPPGARILEIGGGNSRVLKKMSADYECWNLDKLEGVGYGPQSLESPPYQMVQAYAGDFSKELPDDYFDFVFSISALEHTPSKAFDLYERIVTDINRVLKKGGYSLHCFDVVLDVGLVREYYDYIYYEGSLKGQPDSNEVNRFTSIERGHGPKYYCPDIVPHFYKVPRSMTSFPNLNQVAVQMETWTMSKKAFVAGWKPIVKKGYFEFGKPTSLNVLWQK